MQNGVQWTLQKKRMTVEPSKSMYFSYPASPESHGKEASLDPSFLNFAFNGPFWVLIGGIFEEQPVR